ncbi:MAG: hypothetical protein NVS9B15_23200 [Acidobacteriaceae bacterium]
METIRVLHVVSDDAVGGTEKMLANLARCTKLYSARLQQLFMTPGTGQLTADLKAIHQDTASLSPVRLRRPLSLLGARDAFRRTVCTFRPHWTVFHQYPQPFLLLHHIARSFGSGIARWIHNDFPDNAAETLLTRFSIRPDLWIFNSYFMESRYSTLRPSKVLYPPYLSNAVADERLRDRPSARDKPTVANHDVVLVQVSRMVAMKGHLALIDAFCALNDAKCYLWIVGAGTGPAGRAYEAQVRALADRAPRRENIRFWGQRDDVQLLLSSADVYVQAIRSRNHLACHSSKPFQQVCRW